MNLYSEYKEDANYETNKPCCTINLIITRMLTFNDCVKSVKKINKNLKHNKKKIW